MFRRKVAWLAILTVIGIQFGFASSVPLFAQDKADLEFGKLVISRSEFDFGSVKEGSLVEHVFELSNHGQAELNIYRVVPSCGCTVAELSQKTIAPGGKASLRIVFDTKGFSGGQNKLIRVFSDDQKSPAVSLFLRGRIDREIFINPAVVSFGEVLVGSDVEMVKEQEVLIEVRGASTTKLGELVARTRFFTVRELESSDRLKRIKVGLDYGKNLPLGDIRERFSIVLSGGQLSAINVPLLATLKSTISLRPEVISLGVLEGGRPVVRRVDLVYSGTGKVSIARVSSNHSAVDAQYQVVRDGKRFRIDVTVNPAKIQKDLRGIITLRLSGAEKRSIALPVYGVLPPDPISDR